MTPFTILEHPADVGIRARGQTIAEAFQNAALGLMSIIVDSATVAGKESKMITLQGIDREQLLVRFLGEVLYLYDGEGFLPAKVFVNELTETTLSAELHGEPFDPAMHQSRLDVKAITYHQLRISETSAGAEVTVYLDI